MTPAGAAQPEGRPGRTDGWRRSAAETRWLLAASAVALVVASVPTLFAAATADADHIFTGFIYNNEDGNSYLGKMQLGAQGEWLFHLFYTAEPATPVLAFPFHLLLGRMAAGLGLSLPLAYHLARVVCGLALLLAVYAFVSRFTPDITARRAAWILVALGGGLGWLLVALGLSPWLGDHPLEFWVPEGFAFLVLLNLPHLAAAQSLLYGALLCLLDARAGAGRLRTLLAGVMGLGMTLIVPFYALILAASAGAWLVALAARQRAIPWREARLALLAGLPSAPIVAYTAWMWSTDPGLQGWTAQNSILSPHPAHYLLATAPLLVPAVAGARQLLRQGDDAPLLPVAWVAAVPALVYLPFTLQRRLIGGAQAPLALLAGVGLAAWFAGRAAHVGTTSRLRSRTALVGYLALGSLSTWLLVGGSLVTALRQAPPAYRPAGEVDAINWLAAHAAPDDTVLSGYAAGNLIPARAGVRVFYGHGSETLEFAQKGEWVRGFFAASTSDAWRQSLLREYQIAYVFYGPEEQAMGGWDPGTAPYLTAMIAEGGYSIYRVRKDGETP